MTDRVLRFSFLALGALTGSYAAIILLQSRLQVLGPLPRTVLAVLIGALTGLFFVWLLFQLIGFLVIRGMSALNRVSLVDLLAAAGGLITSLLIGVLLTLPLPRQLPVIGPYLPSLVTAVFGYVGLAVAVRKREELFGLLNLATANTHGGEVGAAEGTFRQDVKILDTNVIIDGRVFDVAKSGFLQGRLVVPGFVLRELQYIADSSDPLRRSRGRRGLDTLNRLQKELDREVAVTSEDFADIPAVDDKIVALAQRLGATVVTNDLNLDKICELQHLPVLNLNELSTALRPRVLPGEELVIQIVREGKESGQGVGYLDDGTMVVVEGAKRVVGETATAVVTSALQTGAGRMIFARLR